MSDQAKRPSKEEIADLLLANLQANTADPEPLEQARDEREARIEPLALDGDIVPLPPLREDGSLQSE